MKKWHVVAIVIIVIVFGAYTLPIFDGKTLFEWIKDKVMPSE